MTTGEDVLKALEARLETIAGPTVARNEPLPADVPAGGFIVLFDGDPGDPEEVLGGFRETFYQHVAQIEIYVQHANQSDRDAQYAALAKAVGDTLEADRTLGGLIIGMFYGQPEPDTIRVEGGPAIKSGRLDLQLEYESGTPLG